MELIAILLAGAVWLGTPLLIMVDAERRSRGSGFPWMLAAVAFGPLGWFLYALFAPRRRRRLSHL